jgi:hypothetical protein
VPVSLLFGGLIEGASMSIHDYLIEHDSVDWPNLLSPWASLLPRELTVWLMNRFGDLFLVFQDGTVHMFDVGLGKIKKVASSRDDFGKKLDEGDNANQWLMIPLIDELVRAGVYLQPGECYSYIKPPIMGGDYSVENTAVLPIAKHYGFYGDFHEQTKDMRDGTPVILLPK